MARYVLATNDREEAVEWQNGMRLRFLTADLSDEEVEQIVSMRMDPRHDHLDALLDPERT